MVVSSTTAWMCEVRCARYMREREREREHEENEVDVKKLRARIALPRVVLGNRDRTHVLPIKALLFTVVREASG
jgi:hypothetical protein